MAAPYTTRQGQYLAFIHTYTRLHGQPPAEADMAAYFGVSPPSVHQMVVTLEHRGLIQRTPGQARSLRVLLPPTAIPDLESGRTSMGKTELFRVLSAQQAPALRDLLSHAYDQMTGEQRQSIFGVYAGVGVPLAETDGEVASYEVDGEILLEEIVRFQRESLAGAFYAPFAVNSRNFSHIPEETAAWFDRLSEMLEDTCLLSEQGDHMYAVSCFGVLYTLIDALEKGAEIVFAEEVGTWMLSADKKQCAAAYMTSLAATATPEEFTQAVLPLIRRNAWRSFFTRAYASAIRAGTVTQRAHLEAEIQRQKIPKAPAF